MNARSLTLNQVISIHSKHTIATSIVTEKVGSVKELIFNKGDWSSASLIAFIFDIMTRNI